MTHVSEINILKEKNVKITDKRAILGTKTYAISEIDSVSIDVNEPKLFIPIFFLVIAGVLSVLIALSDMQEYSQCLNTSLYIGIAGLVLFILSRKTKYNVRIRSASGEMKVLEDFDKDHVERVIKALNEAIARKE